MAEHSTIEWTNATWNPITGCTLVSEGCRHCYAAGLAATRLKHHPSRAGLARINAAGEAKFTGEVRFNEHWIDQPLRWRRPRMIFVCAHGDLFHESVPDGWIDRVFAVMALASHHTFQVLTKRPQRARDYLGQKRVTFLMAAAEAEIDRLGWDSWPASSRAWEAFVDGFPNVWLGTSVEDQATADARIPHLLAAPAAVRFLSAEPLLGAVDIQQWLHDSHCWEFPGTCICSEPREVSLDWVIVGGESGAHARPMHPDWPRSLRDQCQAAGVAFFFKQWGAWLPSDQDTRADWDWGDADDRDILHHWDDGSTSMPLKKSAAGRLLDGCTWDEMPGGRDA